ncbi:MAG TPA: YbgA family protein [Haliangium sp.]|nr:YbgA family protein [Haliangium sp.]
MELPDAPTPGAPETRSAPAANAGWAVTVERARVCWERFRAGPLTRGGLVKVHASNKYLLMAHSPMHYRALGRIVAAPPSVAIDEQVARYHAAFGEALTRSPSVGSHVNVLQHLAGYFKHGLGQPERAEIAAAISDFRAGRAPLEHPLLLIAQHARALRIDYLLGQTYLAAALEARTVT